MLTKLLFRSASRFRELSKGARDRYRLTILATICLLIRVKYLISFKKVPKGLKLYVSQDQITARDKFYNLYLEMANPDQLLPTLHQLLVAILCHSTNNMKLACPTDYSICLTCLENTESPAWDFKTPSEITGKYSALQYCFRMIFFTHCYTLAVNQGNYKPLWTPPAPPPTNPLSKAGPTFCPPNLLSELEGDGDAVEVISSKAIKLLGNEEAIGVVDEEAIEVVGEESDQGLLG